MKKLFFILLALLTFSTNLIKPQQQADTIIAQLKKIDSIANKIMSTKLQPYWIPPDVRATKPLLTITDADYNTLYDLLGAMNTAANTISKYPSNSPVIKQVIDSISQIDSPFFKKLAKDFSWVKDWTHKTYYQPPPPFGPNALNTWVQYISDTYLSYLGYDTSAYKKLNWNLQYKEPKYSTY